MTKLVIKRDSGYADRLRSYQIVLDKITIGTIKNNEEVTLEIAEGNHELFLSIDWCKSNVVHFTAKDKPLTFECESNMRGLKIFLAILYTTVLKDDYIYG